MPLKLKKRGRVWHAHGTVCGEAIRQSTKTTDRKRAEAIARRWEREIEDRHAYGVQHRMGFAEAAEAYLEHGEDRFMARVVAAFMDTPLRDIDQAALDRAARKAYPDAKPSTVNRQFYTPFIAVMNYAAEQGWRPQRKWRRPAQPEGRTDWRTPEDIEALIAAAPDHVGRAVIVLTGTMMRATEAVALDARDVAGDGSRVTLWQTKGGYARSVEPLSRARQALTALPPGPVLRQRDGLAWHAYDALNLALKRAAKAAGLPPLSCHVLRHTGATWRYALDPDLPRLMAAGGWKSPSMVFRYTHASSRDLADRLGAHGWAL